MSANNRAALINRTIKVIRKYFKPVPPPPKDRTLLEHVLFACLLEDSPHESAEQVAEIGRAFQVTLQGKQSPQKLAQRLKQIAPQGITEGSLFVPEGYAEIPLLV